MSSIWTRSAVTVASAALLSMAVLPALAQSEAQDPPAEVQAQSPPNETLELPPGAIRQSQPKYAKDTPEDLRLRHRAMAAGKCRSGADTEAEAEEDCAKQLNCQPPTTVKCQYRQNNSDWICSCK